MAAKNIMIVGVGGQGTLLTSRILGGLAIAGGYDVKLSEVHGMAQRGGSVVTFVRYGDKVAEPIVEEGQADVIIAFERLEALRYAHFLKKDGALIINDWRIDPMPVVIGAAQYPENIIETLGEEHRVYTVNATEEAKKIGNPRVFNLIVLGVAAQHMDFTKEQWYEVIEKTVPPKTIEINKKAFDVGYHLSGGTEQVMARVALKDWKEQIRDPKIECMSRDEMTALQSDRLVKQVKNVYENVEFYRKKMDEIGVEPGDIKGIEDIGKLPFTTKEDLRANYPFGLLAVPKDKIVRVQGTSGTTGKLTLASYTQKDIDVWSECVARGLTMAGLTAEDRIHICYGYGLFTGGMGLDFGARKLGAMAIPMSAGNTKRQLMCMEDFGATAFACTPSYALYLAEAANEAGIVDKLQLKVGINGAEPWTEEMRLKIEELLDVNCFDIYGLCEVTGPGVALECIHHNGMHVYEDYFYPEVLNPADNSHCADGEIGELVFTTLAKEGMPLLRYRTKDLTSIDHSTCECGRTLPRISKFKGRTDDMKVIRGVNVFPTQVETALLSGGGGVAPHYLMIVDRENNLDVLTVMVEVDEKYFSDEIRKLDELKNKVAAVLKQALGVAVRVKLVEPKTIERSEGKAKRVIDNRGL